MFTQKQAQLFSVPAKKSSTVPPVFNVPNAFINAGLKKSVETTSGNGALKLSSTLDPFVDSFGKLGSYKAPRSFSEIEKDCELLWGSDKITSIKFISYLRTITRKTQVYDTVTDEPQMGGELKHEPIMRMIWLSQKAPDVFWKNIGLFVSLGSWHDVFTMLQYDLVYNGWDNRKLDWDKFGVFILTALSDEKTSNLVKKYLPAIKARSDCKTVESQANCMIGKWLCSLIFGHKDNSSFYKKYRNLKTSGTAHDWQKLISQQKFDKIDFNKIHGRALNLLVRSKFLKNQNLSEKYKEWVGDPKTKVKYTGFVHELFSNLPYALSLLDGNSQETINKQFATLVEKGKSDKKDTSTNWLPVIDTSGSMGSIATGTTTSCLNIAKSLALYFSEFLEGRFTGTFAEFNSTAKMHQWVGNSPIEKWYNNKCNYIGSTNFQSVIDLIVSIKTQGGVDESEFPTGILCISDGEFNPSQLGKTNVETARAKLQNAGFSPHFAENFQIVLWNLQSNAYGSMTGKKFETTATAKGTFYFSGYNGSVISFLTGSEVLTSRDLFDRAMDQTVINMITM